MSKEIGFSEAMNELRLILEEIEEDEVDLDALAGLVERAASLVKLCRGKITATDLKVREIIEDLHAELESVESPEEDVF